ncbi:MAG: c-type cytochrome, partial [Pseudorhodoplanes sp.]
FPAPRPGGVSHLHSSIPRSAIAALCIVAALAACFLSTPIAASEPTLGIVSDGETRSFTRDALLARPDAADVEIASDIAYGRPMRFRAVPLRALLAGLRLPPDGVIETVASDGFAAHLPVDLVTNADPARAIAWLAIERSDAPWPDLPGKQASAGPFYIVWTGAQAKSVSSEYWAYQVAKLVGELPPTARWPQLAVDPSLPATHAARAGQTLFIAQCLPCHMIDGAGSSDVGPDLNRPMNPTAYMTRQGLHALIRDPKSVRNWPNQMMPGFAPDQMSDRDIDAVIAYLAHMAERKDAR